MANMMDTKDDQGKDTKSDGKIDAKDNLVSGTKSDGKGGTRDSFLIVFLAVGQGDCTLVSCPDGRVLMIDCGSKAYLKDDVELQDLARQVIRDKAFGGNKNKIDVLILTHPDQDHYNQVQNLLGVWKRTDPQTKQEVTFKPLEVEDVYFSSAGQKESPAPLSKYRVNGVDQWIYKHTFSTKQIHEVTINESANYYKTWVKNDGFAKVFETTSISNKMLTLLSGKTDTGKEWRVSIIAGNVVKDSSLEEKATTGENAGSLVTLLQFDTSRALICGDATLSTEAFLLKQHKNLISNIDLLQVPHHGSATSSGEQFVTQTNPKVAVVSVGHMETTHKLPRYDVMDRWIGKQQEAQGGEAQARAAIEHACDSWHYDPKKAKETYNDWVNKNFKIFTKAGDEEGGKQASYYYLYPILQDFADYVVSNNGFLLYREKIDTAMWQTSTLGQAQGKRYLSFNLPL